MYNIMEKIDAKDKKILYQLNQNSRQSFTQIGKKVGLPKSVVVYRVKRLEEKGIIKNYFTLVDAPKMGYTILRFYFTYQYAPPEKRKEIIDFFVKCKYSGIVHTVEGAYELVVYMFIKNLPEFYQFWEGVLKNYRDYFYLDLNKYNLCLSPLINNRIWPQHKNQSRRRLDPPHCSPSRDQPDYFLPNQ